jgi:hypothetical protein
MPIKRDEAEQIVTLLRQIEVETANGKTAPQPCKTTHIWYTHLRVSNRKSGLNGASFALESLTQLGMIGKMRWQDLDGDDAIQAGITGLINLAHSTRTDSSEDFVGP